MAPQTRKESDRDRDRNRDRDRVRVRDSGSGSGSESESESESGRAAAEETQLYLRPSLDEAVRLVGGRIWVVLAVGAIIAGTALLGAQRFRPVYETSALLQLKQPSRARVGQQDEQEDSAAAEAIGPQETVRHLKVSLASPRLLGPIVDRLKAEFEPRELAARDGLIAWIGEHIEVEHRGSVNFRLFARAKDAELAQRLTAALAAEALALHRSSFEQDAVRVEDYARVQVAKASDAIKKLEDEMVTFLERHPALKIKSLGSDQLLGLQESDRMRASRTTGVLGRSLEKLAERHPRLKELLARQRRLKNELHTLGTSETSGATAGLNAALRDARTQLAELRGEGKKDSHPMVAQVLRRIKQLEAKVAGTAPGAQTATSRYESKVRAELARVDRELRAAIGVIAAALPRTPREDLSGLEAEWSRLRRQDQQLTDQYTRLQEVAVNASMRRNLMMYEASKTAAIVEQPRTPERPTGLTRGVIRIAGSLLALLCGLAAALGLAVFDTRLYTADRVQRANPRLELLAVLAEHSPRQVMHATWRARLRQEQRVAVDSPGDGRAERPEDGGVIRWLKATDDLETALSLLDAPVTAAGAAPGGRAEWMDDASTAYFDSGKAPVLLGPRTAMVVSGAGLPAERGQVAPPSSAPLPRLKVHTLPSAPPLAPGLFVSTAPDSRAAEQMRLLAARLESRLASGLRVVAISSWDPGVGKTTVAANLAMVLAESQRRVLAIDACPGAAALTRLFGVEPYGAGLCEQLLQRLDGGSSPWEVVQIAETLTILPGSTTAQPALPLLASDACAQLVRDMLRLFDAVVVDTEALQRASDAVVLQRQVDGYVVVVGRRCSTTRGLRELANRVDPERILGVVFNEH